MLGSCRECAIRLGGAETDRRDLEFMAATYSSLVGLSVGGKYEVRRVLGVGGMGVVCEAIHIDLGKRVAIKLIDKTMKESELIVARFRREARALGQIQSEHIVDVFDVGADTRVGLYMVMEYLPGEDLQSRLEKDKRLDLTTGVMIAHQMSRGLEKAHAAGVIHRDLKPANVFLTTRDNGSLLVKLLDFGVSKVLNEVGGARITGSGAPIGTPLYMSPEQAEGRDDTDGRADIWSLGAVLYEALSGAPPFPDRGSYHGTIVGILTSRPKLLHDAAPWVPRDLAKVIDAMLVHDRSARIKDAATVTKRLHEAFPTVLPDGTGRHTAVIVPTTHAVDATGDTEIFTSQGFKTAQAKKNADAQGDRDSLADEDSKRTVPHLSSAPGTSDEATRTAAATPVEMGRGESKPPETPHPLLNTAKMDCVPGGPKTDPMPWLRGASSSASGVAMPGTPPVIEPLSAHERAPDTQRDEVLAMRAERRRWGMLLIIAAVVGSFAVGGFLVGRHENRIAPDAAGPSAPTPSATQAPTPSTPVSAAPSSAPAPSAGTTTTTPPALPSADQAAPLASAGAAPAPKPRHRKLTPKPPVDGEPKPEEPSVPSNPFPEPAP